MDTELQKIDKLLKQPKQVLTNFGIEFTYHSQRIEGSNITEQETEDIILKGIIPKGKKDFATETLAHYNLFRKLTSSRVDITYNRVMAWHIDQFKTTKPYIAGMPRVVDVGIYGTNIRFPDYRTVPYHLEKFFKWYDNTKNGIHPVYLAALAHLKFVNIHPFEDGNGRTSRLLMNFILHRNGYPMIIINERGRREYYEALNMAREYADDWEFVNYILRCYGISS